MKKILALLLALMLVAALVACAADEPPPVDAPPVDDAPAPPPDDDDEPAPPPDDDDEPAPPAETPAYFQGTPMFPMEPGSQAGFDNIGKDSLVIIYMPPGLELPIYRAIGAGIEQIATENGFTMQTLGPTLATEIAEQLAMMQDAIFMNPDVIIFGTHDDYGAAPLVQQGVEQGIMMIKVNSDIPSFPTPIHAVVGYGQRQGQRDVGEFLVEYLAGREVNLAMTMGLPGWHINERNGGFLEGIAGADNINIVTEVVGGWTVEGGLAASTDLLQAHPEIDVIWGGNDNEARGSQMAAAALGRDDIIFVGNGGDTAGLEAIYDGLIHITAATTPFIIGQVAMNVALAGLTGEFQGGFVETPVVVAHAGNVVELLRDRDTLFPLPTRYF